MGWEAVEKWRGEWGVRLVEKGRGEWGGSPWRRGEVSGVGGHGEGER